MNDMIGKMVGNYRLDKTLGHGGMGSVYEATDITLQRRVALKMMHPHLAARESFQKRFLQEARAIARLEHGNIVNIYQASFEAGQLFLVMELVTGGSLREYLHHLETQDKIIQLPEAVELVRQMADGLHYAHDQQMVHRDIKPDNVLLRPATTPGKHSTFNILLADFGLAQLAENIVESSPGVAKGTFPYMSPEQCLGQRVDQRTDIYALGVVLYELVVGMRPFDPRTLPEAIQMHTRSPLPKMESVSRGTVPVRIQQIIERCLAKEPNNRFQTAYEVDRALASVLSGLARGKVENVVTQPEREDSLVTYLMSQPLPAEPPQHTPITASNADQDRLVIINKQEPTRTMPLESDVVRIGRDAENDLVLQSQKIGVSRYHARIERGVDGLYRITDLESTNGTYMSDEKLEPNRPAIWKPLATVRIGDYWLQIEPGVTNDDTGFHQGTMPQFPQSVQPMAPMAPTPSVPVGPVMVTMTPSQLAVEPGQVADAQLELLNQGDRVDHFRVEVVGLPAEWVTMSAADAQTMPGQRQRIDLRIAPPRTSNSRAGRHPFTVRVHSTVRPDQPTEFQGEMVIAPYFQFTSDNQPRVIHGRGIVTVNIANQGNAVQTYHLTLRDVEDTLKVPDVIEPVTIEPGTSGTTQIPLGPRRRALIGTNQTYGYELDVNGQPQAQTLNGNVNAKPRIPTALAAMAATLAAAACLLLALAANAFLQNQASSQATATAQAIAQERTATAVSVAAAQSLAGTATAEWNAADQDGDGLTNAQEATHRTDPDNPDTDGDGLTDGDEVDRYDTKPRDEDSDEDGLPDGQEIALRTDPNLRDTDGDGLSDGVEVEGGQTDPNLPDTDRDGVNDGLDACHNQPAQGYGFDARGCPGTPTDQDGDGVEDNLDACPNQGDMGFGVNSQGCPNATPNPDPDGDGLMGAADQCPHQAGPASSNGCPDSDGDGIPDNNDSCPHQGSTGHGIDAAGCPLPGEGGGDPDPDEPDQSPEDFIRDYYAAIEDRDYGFTWSHLTNVFKERWNCPEGHKVNKYTCSTNDYDFDAYIGWWNTVDQVDVTKTTRECLVDDIAVVLTSLEYKLFNGSQIVQEDRYVKVINLGGEWHFQDVGENKRTCVFDPWA